MKIAAVMFCDPGHGWLRVRADLLPLLGIADKISRYSYSRNGWAYLEEDCDATKFLHACEASGVEVLLSTKHCNRRSGIRSYESYKAAA